MDCTGYSCSNHQSEIDFCVNTNTIKLLKVRRREFSVAVLAELLHRHTLCLRYRVGERLLILFSHVRQVLSIYCIIQYPFHRSFLNRQSPFIAPCVEYSSLAILISGNSYFYLIQIQCKVIQITTILLFYLFVPKYCVVKFISTLFSFYFYETDKQYLFAFFNIIFFISVNHPIF